MFYHFAALSTPIYACHLRMWQLPPKHICRCMASKINLDTNQSVAQLIAHFDNFKERLCWPISRVNLADNSTGKSTLVYYTGIHLLLSIQYCDHSGLLSSGESQDYPLSSHVMTTTICNTLHNSHSTLCIHATDNHCSCHINSCAYVKQIIKQMT